MILLAAVLFGLAVGCIAKWLSYPKCRVCGTRVRALYYGRCVSCYCKMADANKWYYGG